MSLEHARELLGDAANRLKDGYTRPPLKPGKELVETDTSGDTTRLKVYVSDIEYASLFTIGTNVEQGDWVVIRYIQKHNQLTVECYRETGLVGPANTSTLFDIETVDSGDLVEATDEYL